MVALEAWYDWKAEGPTVVHDPVELDAVLDIVVGLNDPTTVQLLIHGDPGHAILDVGLDATTGRGVLYYAGPDAPEACISKGPYITEPPPIYYFTGSDTEFPADAEIPLADVRRAAHEYMTTGGGRPGGIQWQPRWE
ncbi:Imm1 family immunity protein [Actinosynnema sp. NPDC023658]|uniref:Imm1 family immunity protein n=1 Tax=Actinosynnema sp. NPDC023658 TaxID=3155465 RepID=UPI0033EE92B8